MDREPATSDLIEQEMEVTRAALTDKVAALENQVVGTLQNATETVHTTVEAVQNTVESVKSAVEESVMEVKETVNESVNAVADRVKSTFDLSSHVRERPWAMVGGAVVAGLIVGKVLPPARRASRNRKAVGFRQAEGVTRPAAPSFAAAPPPPEPAKPTWIDDILGMAGREIRKLGEETITLAVQSLRESVREQVPNLVDAGVTSATQSVVRSMPANSGAARQPNGVRV